MTWIDEYGDVVDDQGRELFMDDEMTNDLNAGGDPATSRAYAERVFNRLHTENKDAKP